MTAEAYLEARRQFRYSQYPEAKVKGVFLFQLILRIFLEYEMEPTVKDSASIYLRNGFCILVVTTVRERDCFEHLRNIIE